ncbi:MAG: hypothetical protein CMJ83_01985 [Planctomycetes bacterium]|nr:hypothetical protein [Planctomycetota bacterium]
MTVKDLGETRIALFIDFDNLALGMKQSPTQKFEIHLVLDRVLEKGRILVKKAYADWSRYRDYKAELHESAIELIELPKKRMTGKNSGDIRMVVDAMEVAYSRAHIETFVLVSGDSDFSPLVSKLRENDKEVIGIGIKAASSKLLIENCDEFIYYEDLVRHTEKAKEDPSSKVTGKKKEVYALIKGVVRALFRDGRELVWASMVKQTLKRKRPTFDESYYDYGSFSELLLEMEKDKEIKLEKDQRSGSLLITAVASRRR